MLRWVLHLVPQKLRTALWEVLRSQQVRPFVWVYYIALLAWGLYGTFLAAPATYVLPVMGRVVYDLWIWLHLVGTIEVMIGLKLEDIDKTGRLGHVGLHMQTGGHMCMFFVLLMYEVAAIDATYFGQGTYSIFVISPYVLGCLLLSAQGVVQIRENERPPDGEL